ncbi:MAG: transcriptional repressor [Proteobacteria bacterium]|nr:transcriptional repressor [Pseudomonadota bacterium]
MSDSSGSEDILLSAGIRPTQARMRIMNYLLTSETHPSTEELSLALRGTGVPIPAATLYQSLEKLCQAGLLIRFTGKDGQVRYDANLSVHHHMICRCCNRVCDIAIKNPLSRLGIINEKSGKPIDNWALDQAAIEVKGLCPDCVGK